MWQQISAERGTIAAPACTRILTVPNPASIIGPRFRNGLGSLAADMFVFAHHRPYSADEPACLHPTRSMTQEVCVQQDNALPAQPTWFYLHRTLASAGTGLLVLAFGTGMVMWLGARFQNNDPHIALVSVHVLTALLGLAMLSLATWITWRRSARRSFEQTTTKRQQWLLYHRLLAFATLATGLVMLATGVALLPGVLSGNQVLVLVYGHLLSALPMLVLAGATFLVGWFRVQRSRFKRRG